MASNERSGFWFWLKVVSAGIGVVMGILAGLVFLVYGNVAAGLWAFISSILSSVVLHQHFLFRKSKLASIYNAFRFQTVIVVGILSTIISLSVTIYYFTMKVSLRQETYPIKDSYLISGVWAFMTLKWSFLLTFNSHKYKAKMDGEREYNPF